MCCWRTKEPAISVSPILGIADARGIVTASRGVLPELTGGGRAMTSTAMRQMRAKAKAFSQNFKNSTRNYYANLLDRNQQYIAKDPSVERCRELSKQLFYTRLASVPGRYDSLWKEVDYVKKRLARRTELTTEELGIGALFGLECYLWFCVGVLLGAASTPTPAASKPVPRQMGH